MTKRINGPIEERLRAKISKGGPNGCWNWTAGLGHNGYGQIRCGTPKRTMLRAHRVAFELGRGPVPEGMLVLHTCDNRKCCNPDHMFLGSHADNHADKKAKGRQARGSGHGCAILDEDSVAKIRQLLSEGVTCALIGRSFGVSRYAISDIKNGRSWTHIT